MPPREFSSTEIASITLSSLQADKHIPAIFEASSLLVLLSISAFNSKITLSLNSPRDRPLFSSFFSTAYTASLSSLTIKRMKSATGELNCSSNSLTRALFTVTHSPSGIFSLIFFKEKFKKSSASDKFPSAKRDTASNPPDEIRVSSFHAKSPTRRDTSAPAEGCDNPARDENSLPPLSRSLEARSFIRIRPEFLRDLFKTKYPATTMPHKRRPRTNRANFG